MSGFPTYGFFYIESEIELALTAACVPWR